MAPYSPIEPLHGSLYVEPPYCNKTGHDEIARLRAENEKLRAALAPFAKAGELFIPDDRYSSMVCYAPSAGPEYWIESDHLVAARKALSC